MTGIPGPAADVPAFCIVVTPTQLTLTQEDQAAQSVWVIFPSVGMSHNIQLKISRLSFIAYTILSKVCNLLLARFGSL
jgi:hypothetical protein